MEHLYPGGEHQAGLVIVWDQKSQVFSLNSTPQLQGQVCGLCGNYDGNSRNDFTKRSQEKVADVLEFANSWKVSSDCPNAKLVTDPCASNRYRAAWSQKQCSIIISVTFQSCHSKVDPGPYFDSCVRDSCACDSGGDCECLCTAVAAYAKACNEAGACVKWRTPKLCPVFCDYYNSPGECEWHYKPCGADCMKTCRNPSGNCSTLITALEGCYPQCPPAQPYFDEDTMKCVTWRQCGCYDDKGTHYSIGDKVPSTNCYTCSCTFSGIRCSYNVNSCTCLIYGKTYEYGTTIYNTTDGIGNCITAECGANGTITRRTYPCITTTTPSPQTTSFAFSTVGETTLGATAKATTSIGTITPEGTRTVYTTGQAETTVLSTPSRLTTTTSCVCIVNGTSHQPGDLVYNVNDGLDWCYVAYCNASCKVEIQSSSCTTTPIPSTTAQSTTSLFGTTTKATISSTTSITIPSSTPSTTPVDCNDEYPPRKNGESWMLSNCTTATCNYGTITKTPTKCPTEQQPICANGRQAYKVYDDNGCCFHHECECVCSILAQNHYITFDGKLFNFKENCSYYLVKEIITRYNLTIIVNNHECEPSDVTFCPQTLTITYRSYTVVLSQLKIGGTATNAVYVNQKRIFPAFRNSVLYITSTDMVITLEIPELKTEVVYTGSSISIDLPYTLFGGNTEGQCGTCDNSQNNDCRSPNGQVESCSDSAGQWLVPGTPCVIPTTPSTTTKPTTPSKPATTTQPPCKPAICNILTSSVFKACHTVIPPGPFVKSCVSDNCNSDNNTCTSLEAYATECSNEGVCIDWRNATNGRCEHTCPKNKVYKACGTSVEPTCNDRYNKKFETGSKASTNNTKEGCFCPTGTVLFNTVYDACVASCDCVGPDGRPKEPGDTWISGCNICECDKDSMSIQCEPATCPTVQSPVCSEPGQQLVNKTEGCCTTQSCECNVNLCPRPITCPVGFQRNDTSGTCCQSYECVPKGVCVYDMNEYKEQDNLQEQQQHHQEQDNLQEQQQHHQEQDNLQEQQPPHQEQDNLQEPQQHHQEQDNLQEPQQHHQEQDNLQEQQQHHQEQDNLQEQQPPHQEQDNLQEQQQHHQEQDNLQEQQQHHLEQDNLQEQQQHHQEQDNLQEPQQHHQEQDNLQEQQPPHQEQDNLQEPQQHHLEQDNLQEPQQHHQEQDNLQEPQQHHQEQDNLQEQQPPHQEQDNLQEQQQHHLEQDNLQEPQQHHQEQDNLQEPQQHHLEQDNLQEPQQHHQEQDNLQEPQQHHQEQDNLQEPQPPHQEQDNLQEQQPPHQEQDNLQEQQPPHQEQDNLQEPQQHHREQDNLQEPQQHHLEQDNLQEQQPPHREHRDLSH
ncbi:hypothetical protein CgunFtcFv8_021263 [Champsocephalus gunnari]|uniref:Uncharacterized protein n=1 Tax=Champsocephalus gunnari TaxID=52237 RepID=A0AAN8EJJ7_CHAGU|nr:hypothetical protein CgunFtcFv8_021263 [Champsocephalus gunnari]